MEYRDLRVQKTYTALFHAFQELMKEKDFDSITVKELCNTALVRTATFYKHFSDKYDFFQFMIQELLKEYHHDTEEKTNLDGIDYYISLIKDALSLLQDNVILLRAISSDSMLWLITETQRKKIREEMLEHLENDKKSGHNLATEPEILVELIMGALDQTVRWWIYNNKPCSIESLLEEMTKYLKRLID